jgi:SpoVK/Ycf46/Vps4 family AAA+-type ATPase
MARADLLINLVKAGVDGDNVLFRRTVEAMIAEERAKQHHVLARRLSEELKSNGHSLSLNANSNRDRAQDFIYELTPHRDLDDLVLPEEVRSACNDLVEEHHRSDLLRSYGLEPRHRVLLAGPPGNGKTSLAESLATSLMVPMFVVRYDGIVASYLGETAKRLRHLFDYVCTRQCVLFFDEFDTLGKERGDAHETGEIKRVVSSLLLHIDSLPSYVVIVTATNHPELLDRAVWRRFQLRLHLPNPGPAELEEWFNRFFVRLDGTLGISPKALAEKLKGISFAEAEEFGTDLLRRKVLKEANGNQNLKPIANHLLKQWQARFQPSTSQELE